jgi:hypothetical protein
MTPQLRNARKQAQRMREAAEVARRLQVKRTGKPEIPAKVLKQLASLNLPPNPWVYSVCLDALMRGM